MSEMARSPRRVIDLVEQLKLARRSHEPIWRELGDFVLPTRPRWSVSDTNRGNRRAPNIIDSTATFASQVLTSGLLSGITSSAKRWFNLSTRDAAMAEQPDVKRWLYEVSEAMAAVFADANTYQALAEFYDDIGVFGTACMLVDEDDEDTIRCYTFPIGEYYLGNDAKQRVRVFARVFQMTVRQAVEQFGEFDAAGHLTNRDAFSTATLRLWDTGKHEQNIEVTHVVFPNDRWRPNTLSLDPRKKQFRCFYIEQGAPTDTYLRDSGYDEFPVLGARWRTSPGDVYGTSSPALAALGDIKQLQAGEKKTLKAIDKIVEPPMIAPLALQYQKISMLPGDVTYVQETAGSTVRPAMDVRYDVAAIEGKQEQVRFRINRSFHVNTFLMFEGVDAGKLTATEVIERKEEKLLILGPVLDRLNDDLLGPLIDRTFAIMERRGMIPPAPEALRGERLKVEYESLLAQARRAAGIGALERHVAFVAQVAETSADPGVWDKSDRDQMIAEHARMSGVNPNVVVDDETVAAIRQGRAEAAAAQAEAETAERMANAMRSASQAPTDPAQGRTALTDLLAGAQAEGAEGAPDDVGALAGAV